MMKLLVETQKHSFLESNSELFQMLVQLKQKLGMHDTVDVISFLNQHKALIDYAYNDAKTIWPNINLDGWYKPVLDHSQDMDKTVLEAYKQSMDLLHNVDSNTIQALQFWIGPGKQVLDFGCGSGYFTRMFAGLMGAFVYAVDRKNILGFLRKSEGRICWLDELEFWELKAQKPIFETIFLSQVIHSKSNQQAVQLVGSLVKRFLKPGGHLIIGEINVNSPQATGMHLQIRSHTGNRWQLLQGNQLAQKKIFDINDIPENLKPVAEITCDTDVFIVFKAN